MVDVTSISDQQYLFILLSWLQPSKRPYGCCFTSITDPGGGGGGTHKSDRGVCPQFEVGHPKDIRTLFTHILPLQGAKSTFKIVLVRYHKSIPYLYPNIPQCYNCG